MIGELISAGTSLLGGLLNKSSADANRRSQEALAMQNMAMQREFAQQGVRWRVADARAAGVHPLFALGANTHSFAPVSVGGGSDTSMGDAVASAGQNIGRAVMSGMTEDERAKTAAADALTLEKAGLENELLRTQINSLKMKQLGPAMPSASSPGAIAGQGETVVPRADKFKERPRLAIAGSEIQTNPGWSNAEDIENRYGESVSDWLYGPAVTMADLIHWAKVSGAFDVRPRGYRGGSPFSRRWERR